MKYLKFLNEFTYKDLKLATDPRSKSLSKTLPSGTHFDHFIYPNLFFTTESQTHPGTGLIWNQAVQLLDLPLVMEMPDLTNLQRAQLAISGDLKVKCDCPAFKYRFAYILTQLDSISGPPEGRFPSITNPNLKGSLCKHLESALTVLPFMPSSFAKDLENKS